MPSYTPNTEDHRFAPGDKVEYRSTIESDAHLGEIRREARSFGGDGWLIRPLSANAPQAVPAVYPSDQVEPWTESRWRYNAQAEPYWQRVYESSPTTSRKRQAAIFADRLGLDADALYAGAVAAWSNLNPQSAPFTTALSVAGAVLVAAETAGRS